MEEIGAMITALALYFSIVLGGGTMLRGLTAVALLRDFTTPAGGIYPILLILVAAMPLLVNDRQGRIAP